eukprot:scaffold101798_cov40-Tisochrysis_lutea.AAC.1
MAESERCEAHASSCLNAASDCRRNVSRHLTDDVNRPRLRVEHEVGACELLLPRLAVVPPVARVGKRHHTEVRMPLPLRPLEQRRKIRLAGRVDAVLDAADHLGQSNVARSLGTLLLVSSSSTKERTGRVVCRHVVVLKYS